MANKLGYVFQSTNHVAQASMLNQWNSPAKPAKLMASRPQLRPLPCSNTDSVTGCKDSSGDSDCGSALPIARSGAAAGLPARPSVVLRQRLIDSHSVVDVVQLAFGLHTHLPNVGSVLRSHLVFVWGRGRDPTRAALLGPLLQARCLSAADINVLVRGLLHVTVTSATLLRGFLQLVTLSNASSAKLFHGASRRLCNSRAVNSVQVFDAQEQRASVRCHQFTRQHVSAIFI